MELSHDELKALEGDLPTAHVPPDVPIPSQEVKDRAKAILSGERKSGVSQYELGENGQVISASGETGASVLPDITDAQKLSFLRHLFYDEPFTMSYYLFGNVEVSFRTLSAKEEELVSEVILLTETSLNKELRLTRFDELLAIASINYVKLDGVTILSKSKLDNDLKKVYEEYLNRSSTLILLLRKSFSQFRVILSLLKNKASDSSFWKTQ